MIQVICPETFVRFNSPNDYNSIFMYVGGVTDVQPPISIETSWNRTMAVQSC